MNVALISSSGCTASGSGVIHSVTLVAAGSTPAELTRTRSRSVRMPTTLSPSETTTEPTPRSSIRPHASDTESEADTVRTSPVITSPTVRTLAPSVTRAPFPFVVNMVVPSIRAGANRSPRALPALVFREDSRCGSCVVGGQFGHEFGQHEHADDAGHAARQHRELS